MEIQDKAPIIGRVRLQVLEGITAFDRFKLKYFSNGKYLPYILKLAPAKYRVIQDTGFQKNLVTSAGKAAIAGLLGNTGAVTAFSYLGLGTSATAAAVTDTILGAELSTLGLSRSQGTVSRITTSVSNDTLQITFTWTASGSTTVNEIGIFNASSSGILLAHKAPITAVSVISGNILVGTYTVQFT